MRINKKNLILEIISDFWEDFKSYRPAYATKYYDKVINKVLSCGDQSEGYIRYQCTYCGEDDRVIGFTCKSAFCLRCGSIKGMKFVEEVKAKLYVGIDYRHLTLTMPDELWKIFYKNRHTNDLFNRLYETAWEFIKNVFQTVLRKEKILVGAIMVIHVTGRKSSFNVHLHILLPMGAIDEITGEWIHIPCLPYNLLHFRWKKYLLKMLEAFDDSPDMKNLVTKLFKKYKKGFVANLDPRTLPKGGGKLAKYLAKYLFSPSISVRRILKFDEKKKLVKYEYNDHETHKKEIEEIGVLHFVGRMAQQIMPEYFQRVRYFGLHSTRNGLKNKIKVVHGLQRAKKMEPDPDEIIALKKAEALSFRERIIYWKKKDPLKCKKCGRQMELVQVWIKGRGFVFDLFDKMATGPPQFIYEDKMVEFLPPKIELFAVQQGFCF